MLLALVRIGIDLGGTKTEILALDDGGGARLRRRVATPAHDYDAIVATIAGLVRDAERELGATGTVGVGIPGSISPRTGLVRNANTQACNGRALRQDLAAALAREVRLANDANCFALSEATDGAGQGASIVFGVILGTGCGGGVVVDGRVRAGAHGIAGEWGHNPLPWASGDELPGPACWCGKHGCIEAWLSGPALLADHRRSGGAAVLDVPAIVAAAQRGEAIAIASLQRHCDRLARALATVVDVLDPDVIVLGGGVGQLPGLCEGVRAQIGAHMFCDYADVTVCTPVHGDASGVRGAAWLW